jgi:hypothetical protein
MAGNTSTLTIKNLEDQVRSFGPVSLCARPPLPLKTVLGRETQSLVQGGQITAKTRLKNLSQALKSDYKDHQFHWLMDERVLDDDTRLATLSLEHQRHPMRGENTKRFSHELSLLSISTQEVTSYSDVDDAVRLASNMVKKAESHEQISAITDVLGAEGFWNGKLADWQRDTLQTVLNAQTRYLSSTNTSD